MSAELGNLISAMANVVVAIIAGIALYIGWRQVHVSREISALEAYENYHLVSLDHPKFATGNIDFDKASAEHRECYSCYVSYALMTGERIMSLFPHDEGWVEAIKDDIRIHRSFIASDHFKSYRDNQTERMSELICEVLAEPV